MENQVTTHIVKGLILSVISIAFSIVVYVFNLYDMSALSFVNYAIFIGGLVYGAVLYSNQNGHNVTFGNLFAHGFKTTAVVIVITSVYTILAFKVLFPDMLEKVLDLSKKKMLENPKMTDEMVDQAMSMTRKFFIPFALGGAVIGTGILGAIGSLIGAAIAKKNPNPFSENAGQ
jgi:hypothetical protein